MQKNFLSLILLIVCLHASCQASQPASSQTTDEDKELTGTALAGLAIFNRAQQSLSSGNPSNESCASTQAHSVQSDSQSHPNLIARVQQAREAQSTLRPKKKSYSTDDFVSEAIQAIKQEHPKLTDMQAYQLMLTREKK